jgi:hypothetical protein
MVKMRKRYGPLIWTGMASFIDIKVPKRLRKSEELLRDISNGKDAKKIENI